ncbi:MAG: hypothetical protein KDK36_16745, partial [Leptospiraceae bacterium]|nr:hypothetical protein [Leptospiraceae bacterium]
MFLVGVGASAGGLEAITELLNNFPEDLEISLIIAQHLSPNYKSRLVSLLSKDSKLKVVEIENNMEIKPGFAYITPPDNDISIKGSNLLLSKPHNPIGPKPSIDQFFISLAQEFGTDAIGIILSGTGSDGSNGVRAIKENDGLVLVQEPNSAKYDGMPLSAIETNAVDYILTPDRMGSEIKEIISDPQNLRRIIDEVSDDQKSLNKLFLLLSQNTGTDFSDYKPTTILRRLIKRLDYLRIPTIKEYIQFIESNPEEIDVIFRMILIGVTEFFREPEAFLELEKYLQHILQNKKPGDPIRIWTPGTSSGEEAYSIAILIAKITGINFINLNIQIFATDIDDKAIQIARKGIYHSSKLEKIPQDIVADYFTKINSNEYELNKSIRSIVLFSKHDITNNPPFLKLDLICCRNLLIYFGSNLQKQIFPMFHYALNENGYLFLGKSETIGQFSDLFSTVSNKYKIFQKRFSNSNNIIRFGNFKNKKQVIQTGLSKIKKITNEDLVKDSLFKSFEFPMVLINDNMDIIEIYGEVSNYLGLSQGIMNSNIIKLANPDIQIELRSCITKAIKERKLIKSNPKKIIESNKKKQILFRIKAYPASNNLYLVLFEELEVSEHEKINSPQAIVNDSRIKELELELFATREHLQAFIEELETSNEELQSLNEEIMSTNEELQSSNEELETSNEELQSTNEELNIAYSELKSVNDLLEKQSTQLAMSEVNATTLLNITPQIYFLLDKNYTIKLFNEKSLEYTKLFFKKIVRSNDSIMDYIFPKFIQLFQENFQKAFEGNFIQGDFSTIDDINKKTIWFNYNFTPITLNSSIEMVAFSLLDTTETKASEKLIKANKTLLNTVFNKLDKGAILVKSSGVIKNINSIITKLSDYQPEQVEEMEISKLFPEINLDIFLNISESIDNEMMEVIFRKKDGNLTKVIRRVTKIKYDDYDEFLISIEPNGNNTSISNEYQYRHLGEDLKNKTLCLFSNNLYSQILKLNSSIESLDKKVKNENLSVIAEDLKTIKTINKDFSYELNSSLSKIKKEVDSIKALYRAENILLLTISIINYLKETKQAYK